LGARLKIAGAIVISHLFSLERGSSSQGFTVKLVKSRRNPAAWRLGKGSSLDVKARGVRM
jgi:hypothetical protein